ncbi:hypothetical protein M514_08281 [Trichuris suis]|uniref:Uncharacterized protein n=1 Tax=Trichuris suis TaxID=68888 RepID=A0A085M0U7_9BILA|nr:hypothetical protein M513_08281 [Trichuris suis]KFD68923.1 hypothetical protein M514_08281 [Trichuris suis]
MATFQSRIVKREWEKEKKEGMATLSTERHKRCAKTCAVVPLVGKENQFLTDRLRRASEPGGG